MRKCPGVVVVCTRNRPAPLIGCLTAVAESRPNAEVVVWDASDGDESTRVCIDAAEAHPELRIHHERATRVGLARQRNDAVAHLQGSGFEVVHFIDDDLLVGPGYFDTIEQTFAGDESIAGVGGVSQHVVHARLLPLKKLFLIDGDEPGTVLPSGRPVRGQSLDAVATGDVDWLVGASMSYRLPVLSGYRFDDRMVGRSLAEDLCLSYAISRKHRLVVNPDAVCLHNETGHSEGDPKSLAIERILTLDRFVRETQDRELRSSAFWRSVLGELVLYGAVAMARPRELEVRGRAHGTLIATWALAKAAIGSTSHRDRLLPGGLAPIHPAELSA